MDSGAAKQTSKKLKPWVKHRHEEIPESKTSGILKNIQQWENQ
jgi:hypothetical protein